MHRSFEVEMRGQRRQVVGVVIHVMAATGLAGAAMAAPVVGYDAIAVLEEEQHLRVPIIGRQRPAVAEDDGLTFTPVFVVDLRAVIGSDCGHRIASFVTVGERASPPRPFCRSGTVQGEVRAEPIRTRPSIKCLCATTMSATGRYHDRGRRGTTPQGSVRCRVAAWS